MPAVEIALAGTTPLTLIFDPATALIVKTRYSVAGAADAAGRRRGGRSRTIATSSGLKVAFKMQLRREWRAGRRSQRVAAASTSTSRSMSRSSSRPSYESHDRARDDLVRRAVGRSLRRRARDRDLPARPVCRHHRIRRRSPAGRGRVARRRLQRLVGHRAARSRARAAAHVRDVPAAGGRRGGGAPRRLRRDRLPRLQLRARPRAPQARRADRLLHQPAALGVAPRPHEDDEAARRSRAGHLSVRGAPSTGRRACRSSGSGIRCSTWRSAPEPRAAFLRALGARSRSAGRRAAARAAAATSCAPSCRISRARPSSSAIGFPDVQFVVARAPHLGDEDFEPLRSLGPVPVARSAGGANRSLAIVEGHADDVLAAADVALVASGTVTVQAALHECPMVVVYRLSAADVSARQAVRSRRHVRDGESRRGTPRRARADPGRVHAGGGRGRGAARADGPRACGAACGASCARCEAKLGTPGASRRAAEAVLEVARGPRTNLGVD